MNKATNLLTIIALLIITTVCFLSFTQNKQLQDRITEIEVDAKLYFDKQSNYNTEILELVTVMDKYYDRKFNILEKWVDYFE